MVDKLGEATKVLSSLNDLIKMSCKNGPRSLSPAILSAKVGIGKFSGSFLSIHCFHCCSSLTTESGNSLKKQMLSFEVPKWRLIKREY